MMVKYVAIALFIAVGILFTACPGTGPNSPAANGDRDNSVENQTPAGGGGTTGSNSNAKPGDNDTNKKPDKTPKADFLGTKDKTSKAKQLQSTAILADVRTGKHFGFDRVVFEFKGTELPGYYIEYIGKPVTECGSGKSVDLTGGGRLEVRFTPAQAHTDAGVATVSNRVQNPGYKAVKQLKSTCDFEGNVTWVIGVSSVTEYRLLELKNPTRLSIDIEQ
jgi:hypothetical protein